MTKTFLALAAANTLTLSMALAQTAAPNASQNLDPEAPTNVQSSPMTAGVAPKEGVITGQTADQWLASKFKGTQVIGLDDNKVGSVDDLLFDRTGSVRGIVVGVGGFLGIGAKQVAFPMGSFDVVAGKDGAPDQLRLNRTREQLAASPEFKPYEPPRSASSGPSRPATSGKGPSSPPPARQ